MPNDEDALPPKSGSNDLRDWLEGMPKMFEASRQKRLAEVADVKKSLAEYEAAGGPTTAEEWVAYYNTRLWVGQHGDKDDRAGLETLLTECFERAMKKAKE